MINSEWKINVSKDINGFLTRVWIYTGRSNDHSKVQVLQMIKGEPTMKEFDVSDTIPCTFAFPLDKEAELIGLLMETFNKQGYEQPKQSFVQGKLEATERHLEDMRNLIFKKGK